MSDEETTPYAAATVEMYMKSMDAGQDGYCTKMFTRSRPMIIAPSREWMVMYLQDTIAKAVNTLEGAPDEVIAAQTEEIARYRQALEDIKQAPLETIAFAAYPVNPHTAMDVESEAESAFGDDEEERSW